MEYLGWRERSSKIWRSGQEIDTRKVPQVDSCPWKESKLEDANKEGMKSYNRSKKGICSKEEEEVSVVKERKERGIWVYWRTIEKEVYQTLKITSNSTGVFCRKEGW